MLLVIIRRSRENAERNSLDLYLPVTSGSDSPRIFFATSLAGELSSVAASRSLT